MTIGIADDQMEIRQMLTEKLHGLGFNITVTAVNGEDLLDKLAQMPRDMFPEIIFVDLEMPKMDGINTIAVANAKFPSIRFIVLTVFDNTEKIFDAIKAGASGYLLKNDNVTNFKEAIASVIQYNGVPMSPAIARKTFDLLKGSIRPEEDPANSILSKREKQILLLMVDGMDYKEIAAQLFISAATVRTHIANIYQKLHVKSKAQAIGLAYKNKWTSGDR